MSQSELLFLLLGLGVGIAAGAALLDVLRAHPPRPEVRLTVTHNALPARTAMAGAGAGAFGDHGAGVMDDARPDRDARARAVTPRDRVVVPVSRGVDPAYPMAPVSSAASLRTPPPRGAAQAGRARAEARTGAPVGAGTARASSGSSGSAALGRTDMGPCGDARRVASERCTIAARAREGATAAADELRRAKRELDDLASRESAVGASGDPRSLHEAKDAAQAEFRRARDRASSPGEIEAAATTWLREIDRINRASRGGSAAAADARRRSSELTVRIESLTLAADAARISAESTALACQTAREALAACEEAASRTAAPSPARPTATPPLPSASTGDPDAAREALEVAGRPPFMVRLLQGDRSAMSRVVATLAGEDPEARRTWQLLLSELVDAILARAIEECVLDFPTQHEFWGEFSRSQCRDIARALASLGYRFDGLGGFADGRAPTQRDLSLAVGYAGLESMRIRRWPTESGRADLYREVAVAADEFLAAEAGDLTLGEMVGLLERRAERLAELWNAWGRVRPLLLAPAGG